MAKKTNAPAERSRNPRLLGRRGRSQGLGVRRASTSRRTAPPPADQPDPRPQSTRTERARAADKIAGQTGSVANDDRFQASQDPLWPPGPLLAARPTWIAALVSVVWVVAVVLLAARPQRQRHSARPQFFGSSDFISLFAARRHSGPRLLCRRDPDPPRAGPPHAATAITQAAIRLAEPETTASEKVASVGQAVRREVNALGDGLERALSPRRRARGDDPQRGHRPRAHLFRQRIAHARADPGTGQPARSGHHQHRARPRGDHREPHRPRLRPRHDQPAHRRHDRRVRRQPHQGARDRGQLAQRRLRRAHRELRLSSIDNRTSHLLTALDDSGNRLNITLEDRASTISAWRSRTARSN